MKKEHPFAFAGLWEHWGGQESSDVDSCTIITTDANDLLRPIHDRMPVIPREDDYDRWLDPKLEDTGTLEGLLKPYPPEEMTAYAISALVNGPRNDSPACIEPAGRSLDFTRRG
jgi:putative SOS response-associated peptidase YedK